MRGRFDPRGEHQVSLDEYKRRERAQAIGLFRYQLICAALDEGLSTKQRGRLVRQLAGQTHTDPFGNQVRISRGTLDRWICRYRRGRFEAADPNELWVGDALHGPRVGDRKTYLFGFLDDHSRLATGYRFGYAEDTVRLAAALRPALGARGVPRAVYVDNGSAFCDAWLLRACAKLGVSLVHSQPGRPQGRGKVERFFLTVREQFLVEVTDTTSEDLAAAGVDHQAALLELNRLFIAWVETEYHRRIHSETGQSPLARWEAGWDRLGRTPAIPTADDLTEAFLWSQWRTVTKTATVSLHANTYQVDAGLVGRRVELVFSPFDLETVEVRYRDKSYGKALPHIISRHTHPKAKPEITEPESLPRTGIDYLALTATAHHEQLRHDERIGYHALYGDDCQIPGQLSIDDVIDHDGNGEVPA